MVKGLKYFIVFFTSLITLVGLGYYLELKQYPGAVTTTSSSIPRPNHILIVVEENHSDADIIGNPEAPYINSLLKEGVNFTASYAERHPSQPNYLALFSGSTQGVLTDSCPHTFSSLNLAETLSNAGYSFAGYSEDMPTVGYTGCTYKSYARKHNPWVNFTNVPSNLNLPFTKFPSNDLNQLPTVSFVIPSLENDMHNGTVQQADTWLKQNIDPYVQWAKKNNSLFILTWDEGDLFHNKIPTLFVGPMVKPGVYPNKINHYNVLRTIEEMYGLPYLGKSIDASPIQGIWK